MAVLPADTMGLTVTILGCGGSGGVPLLGGPDGRGDWGSADPGESRNRRTRSSIAVRFDVGGTVLVDAGPDLREQLLRDGTGRVEAIILTHAHADHVLGLDEVRPLNRALGTALPLYGTETTLDDVRMRFEYAFRPATPGFFRPALQPRPLLAGDTIRIGDIVLETFDQDHAVMRTLGLRSGGFAYSTDVVQLPEESLSRLHGLDTWIVGCFQRRQHPVHANIDQVMAWVERVRPRRTVLTHMGTDLDWGWMARNLPPGIEAAHDGMILRVD